MTVSVIVPVYNAGDYVFRCLESIAGQTFEDFECLIIDDGSTDESGMICDHFATVDPRFVVIHKSNGGVSSARNEGLKLASGQWIFFVDADDYIHPDTIKILLSGQTKDAEVISADYTLGFHEVDNLFADAILDRVNEVSQMNRTECMRSLFSRSSSEAAWAMVVWNKLYSRKLIGDLLFDEFEVSEDALFNFRVFLRLSKMARIARTTYCYNQSPSSLSHSELGLRSLEQIRVFQSMLQLLPSATDKDAEEIKGLVLSKLYRKLLTSRFHIGEKKLKSDLKIVTKDIVKTYWSDFYFGRYIPFDEKLIFITVSLFPWLTAFYKKMSHN